VLGIEYSCFSFVSSSVPTALFRTLEYNNRDENALDYVGYNTYIHSIGHWNNQSILPINRWKSNHVRDVVLTKRCGNASKKPFGKH